MATTIIKGSDQDLIIRLQNKLTGDPTDLTGVYTITACFTVTTLPDLELIKKYLARTGDVTSLSPIVINTDTTDMAIGDLVTGPDIPSGTTILTVDSPTQFTMDQNATNTVVGEVFIVGDITLINPLLWGKFLITLSTSETDVLDGNNIEVKVIKSGITEYVQFLNALKLVDRIC